MAKTGRQHSQVLVEEHVNDEITSLGVVEEDEETPVNQPGALLQPYQGIRELLEHNRKTSADTHGPVTLLIQDSKFICILDTLLFQWCTCSRILEEFMYPVFITCRVELS